MNWHWSNLLTFRSEWLASSRFMPFSGSSTAASPFTLLPLSSSLHVPIFASIFFINITRMSVICDLMWDFCFDLLIFTDFYLAQLKIFTQWLCPFLLSFLPKEHFFPPPRTSSSPESLFYHSRLLTSPWFSPTPQHSSRTLPRFISSLSSTQPMICPQLITCPMELLISSLVLRGSPHLSKWTCFRLICSPLHRRGPKSVCFFFTNLSLSRSNRIKKYRLSWGKFEWVQGFWHKRTSCPDSIHMLSSPLP